MDSSREAIVKGSRKFREQLCRYFQLKSYDYS